MNMQSLMMQAKKLQGEIEKISNEIDSTTYKYENSNVLVECLGNNTIKKIEIKDESVLADKEMLGDIILVAINDVLNQIKDEKQKKLGKYTNGLGGLL